MNEITSAENRLIKHIRKLSNGAYRKKHAETVLEGERLVYDAVRYGGTLSTVLLREDYRGRVPQCASVYKVAGRVFDMLAETQTPQGILATAQMNFQSADAVFRGGLVVLCDAVQDPGNLGTIIRTAHAAGADGVVLLKGCCDPFAPKTVRASMGSVFSVPLAEADSMEKPNGYTAFCGVLSEKAKPLFELAFPQKTILVLGNEGNGASEDTISKSDVHVLIPMPGGAESLNVAAAGAVLMYDYVRQVQNVQ